MRVVRALSALVAAALLGSCGGVAEDTPLEGQDPGPVHVHGLGIDPADGALFVATHTGLYRAAQGEEEAVRVGDRHQDTMGFAVVGPGHFLGSGHPDARDDLPPLLGLIESRDAGRTWKPVSLLGSADFHVLRAAGERIYGFDATSGRLYASPDAGASWETLDPPEPLLDLVPDPGDPEHLVAAGSALHRSTDAGRTWTAVGEGRSLLAWPAAAALYRVDADGTVSASADRGDTWERRGTAGGEPSAFAAASATELYVALHGGAVKLSRDGGRSWSIRSRP
jgi:hypothetical protein